MNKRLQGSYTIEAAFVMAIVLWAVVFSIQAAYRLRDETVGAMALQGAAERLRHGEDEAPETAEAAGLGLAGHPFSWKQYMINMSITGNSLTGRTVKANGFGGTWSLEIEQEIYDPENFLRMTAIFDREE